MHLIKSNCKEIYNVTKNIYLNAVAYEFFSSSKNPEQKKMYDGFHKNVKQHN